MKGGSEPVLITNQADDRLRLGFGEMSVSLCKPESRVHRATCGPRASVCPLLILHMGVPAPPVGHHEVFAGHDLQQTFRRQQSQPDSPQQLGQMATASLQVVANPPHHRAEHHLEPEGNRGVASASSAAALRRPGARTCSSSISSSSLRISSSSLSLDR